MHSQENDNNKQTNGEETEQQETHKRIIDIFYTTN